MTKPLKPLKILWIDGGESFLRDEERNYNIILKYILRFLGINPLNFTPDEA